MEKPIDRLVDSVGVATFIKYFKEFYDLSKGRSTKFKIKELFGENSEPWKDGSMTTKINAGLKIFTLNRELEAIDHILNVKKTGNIPNGKEIKKRAFEIMELLNGKSKPNLEVVEVNTHERIPMWIDDIKQALMNINGFGTYPEIYAEIENIRTNLSGKWQIVVRRTIQQHSSDSKTWNKNKDVFHAIAGIGGGIWGLRDFYPKNQDNNDLKNELNKPITRVNYVIKRIVRDTSLCAQLKEFHENTCQICSLKLQIGENNYYSEGHHIKPLGKPHNGPDSSDNIIVVCPNCHIKCDYSAITLNAKSLSLAGRKINPEYTKYHNNLVQNKIK